MILYTHIEIPLGSFLLVGKDGKLTGLYFQDGTHTPPIGKDWQRRDDDPLFRQAASELAEFAAGTRRAFTVPFNLKGTRFQMKVWQAIASIPYGETRSYAQVAAQIGAPKAARAAGAAAGKNPICWLVPCHRVIGKRGAITGYAGGVERKKALLALEATAR